MKFLGTRCSSTVVIPLLLLLLGCAGDSTTSLDVNVIGTSIKVTGALDGTKDTAYAVVFSVEGGAQNATYYWNVSGTLPAGVTMNPSNGTTESATLVLTGTPTVAGQYAITLGVDAVPSHQPLLTGKSYSIIIFGASGTPPQVTNMALFWPLQVAGAEPQSFSATGGTPPYTWSATAATLPPGLTLSPAGTLSGTATQAGTFDVEVTVVDDEGRSTDKTVQIRVIDLSEFQGTWSGVITKGSLAIATIPPAAPGYTFEDATGQRLSLLLNAQGNITKGTLHARIIGPTAFTLGPYSSSSGPTYGLNGISTDLQILGHLVCSLATVSGVIDTLHCIAHSLAGPQYNPEVVLTKVSASDQDSTAPSLTNPPGGAGGTITVPQITITFGEPMSGSAAIALSGGAGTAGPVTFTNATIAVVAFSGLVPSTSYTLILNPAGQAGPFMDLAGNPLPQTTITFTTSGTLATATLNVTKAGAGTGSVAINPPGSTCGSSSTTCLVDFVQGDGTTLTAGPSSDSTFTGWSGGGCSGTGPCTVTMDASKTVTATFALIPTYTLTVTFAGSGSGAVVSNIGGLNCGAASCSGTFLDGTMVVLTASAANDSNFAGWGGDCSSASCTLTMNATKNVIATFSLNPVLYTLTVTNPGGGTVTSSPSGVNCPGTCSFAFNNGQDVTLTATPSATFTFGGWGGACSGTGTCAVTMNADTTVSATFIAGYTLTVNKSGNGEGTVTISPPGTTCGPTFPCSASYTSGTVVTLSALASGSSTFGGWTGGGCPATGDCQVTMNAAQTVTATFTNTSGGNRPPTAKPQTIGISKRQTTTAFTDARYAIQLTGTDPEGGPLTFKIVDFPTHRDTTVNMNVVASTKSYDKYVFVDPDTGAKVKRNATTSSYVDLGTGDISVAPSGSPSYISYVPQICHYDDFSVDSFTFVAIDAQGAVSAPATVTLNVSSNSCAHSL